jgi:hypothetical protein
LKNVGKLEFWGSQGEKKTAPEIQGWGTLNQLRRLVWIPKFCDMPPFSGALRLNMGASR